MVRKFPLLAVAAAMSLVASNVWASIQFDAVDQNVTNDVIYGSGNANGGFAVGQNPQVGVELGLRTHVRFPTPLNVFNSNGDGTYTYPAGNFGPGGTHFAWNFDWSINSNYNGAGVGSVGTFSYELRIDFDPSAATAFLLFDPIAAGGDHSFGTNATGNGAGLEAPGDGAYASLVANNNLAQNSWRHTFFGAVNPALNGIYDIELSAYRTADNGERFHIETVGIQVINGEAPVVPEPAALLTWGGLALAASGFWFRRNKAA